MSVSEQSAIDPAEDPLVIATAVDDGVAGLAPSFKPVLLLIVLLVAAAVGAMLTTSSAAAPTAPSVGARSTLVAAATDLGRPSQSSFTSGQASVRAMVWLWPGKAEESWTSFAVLKEQEGLRAAAAAVSAVSLMLPSASSGPASGS